MKINYIPLALLAAAAALPTTVSAAPKAPAYHVLRTISVTGDGGWDYLEADATNHRLYIARGTHVQVVDTVTGTLAGDIPDTNGVHGVALAAEAGTGFASCGRSNSVSVFDAKTLKTVGTVAVGQRPDAIIYDPASKRVFTMNAGSNDSTAIDAKTQKVAGTIALGGRPEFATADGMGHVYVNLEDKSEIVELDSKALTVMHTWPLAPGTGPSGLSMDAKNRRLFSVCDNNKMIIMDADTGKIIATPTIGNGPDACKFDPTLGIAFSPNGEDGTLTIVHEDTPDMFSVDTITGTVPTQPGARTMTVDTVTHHVFLVTAKPAPDAPAAAPAPVATAAGTPAASPAPATRPRRRGYAPGSFVVLELAP